MEELTVFQNPQAARPNYLAEPQLIQRGASSCKLMDVRKVAPFGSRDADQQTKNSTKQHLCLDTRFARGYKHRVGTFASTEKYSSHGSTAGISNESGDCL